MDNHTRGRIVREPLPEAMPRRLQARLAWLERLEHAVAVDVYATYVQLRRDGWPVESAVECAGAGFVTWLAAHLEHAADAGLAFARATEEAA